jgi:hypothetical protein
MTTLKGPQRLAPTWTRGAHIQMSQEHSFSFLGGHEEEGVLDIVSLAHNVSFWVQKLTHSVSFWAQKLTHYVSFWVQKI